MGGRRAGSLTKLVGKGGEVATAKGGLTRAVSTKDPDAIAEASVRLIAQSSVGLEALRYSLKLAPYISRNARRLAQLSREKRDEEIRKAWSSVKRANNLETSSELDNTVISAAHATFSKTGSKQ